MMPKIYLSIFEENGNMVIDGKVELHKYEVGVLGTSANPI